ncbi:hypothetical protein CEE37_00075 [candidate division LCP-89 bacterium B3_LCP]|uniref:DUF4350 domain-containing protein n=1 Tax=candidate division LCP-89 bacterium B3_LCP TaxID=2012998 RepID=A0A532V4M0_UNCL8|nr:MAG: hypothetical protein CEE37_00075 [candidate division LCP-89 bacterium B3_LCP]
MRKSSLNQESASSFILTAPLGFLALALLCCQLGALNPVVSRPLGGFLWLLVVFLSAGRRRVLWSILTAVLLFNPIGPVHRPEGLFLLALLPWAGGSWGRRWMGAALIAAIFSWIWTHHPEFWFGLDELSAGITQKIADANLSSAASGLRLIGIALCFPLASMLSERRIIIPLCTAAVLVLSLLIYWWMIPLLNSYLHHHGLHGLQDAFSLQWALLILVGFVLTIWGLIDSPEPIESPRKRGTFVIPILVFTGALLSGWTASVGTPRYDKEVVFYHNGYLNWDLPHYGTYGRGSSGMFGLIPDYLSWRGFKVSRQDSLSSEVLSQAGVVVIINLKETLSSPETKALQNFVSNGGSLLLMGDHTSLSGIREPSNKLLKPYGIELNFDSAKPHRTGWSGSLSTASHPLTAGLGLIRQGGSQPGVSQIWVGASLDLSSPAIPLIVGRESWSDSGDSSNVKDGYLGNFRYAPDERLGNQILVAEAIAGDGKVLVFGDTSTLQNGALARSSKFVERMFSYMLSPVTHPPGWMKILGILLLAGSLLIWSLSGAGFSGLTLGSLALFLALGFCQNRTSHSVDSIDMGWIGSAPPRAVVDLTHAPRCPLNLTSAQSVWGLNNCLLRSGFLPIMQESWNDKVITDAKVIVEIAPVRRFDREERRALTVFMDAGGLLIICCGYEEYDGSQSILDGFGVEPLNVPLGPAEVAERMAQASNNGENMPDSLDINIRFHEAWEIGISNPQAEVLLNAYDKPALVFLPQGEGGLLYIADTEFLTNNNLESPTGNYHEGNILYLRYLLRKFAGGR